MRSALAAIVIFLTGAIYSTASAGDALGWHRTHRYGTHDTTHQDVWNDLCRDVYGKGELDDLYSDPCHLFDLGCGFWACPGCRYAPLHYHAARHDVLSPAAPYAGSSWYRGVPAGSRREMPLRRGEGAHDHSEHVP